MRVRKSETAEKAARAEAAEALAKSFQLKAAVGGLQDDMERLLNEKTSALEATLEALEVELAARTAEVRPGCRVRWARMAHARTRRRRGALTAVLPRAGR